LFIINVLKFSLLGIKVAVLLLRITMLSTNEEVRFQRIKVIIGKPGENPGIQQEKRRKKF